VEELAVEEQIEVAEVEQEVFYLLFQEEQLYL
jgi:hypothetical protein